jgi:hypothetical protein
MLFLAVIALFGTASLVAAALAHDERRWRYAASVAVACGAVLSLWNAELLAGALEYLSVRLDPFWYVLLGALPCALVLADVWLRRRRTPRFKPSRDDDPSCDDTWLKKFAARASAGRPKNSRRRRKTSNVFDFPRPRLRAADLNSAQAQGAACAEQEV